MTPLTAFATHSVQPGQLITSMRYVPFDVCAERLGIRERDLLEADSVQKRVHAAYGRAMREHPEYVLVDTSGPVEPTADAIAGIVDRFLAAR